MSLGNNITSAVETINTVDFTLISLLPNGRIEARNLWEFLESKKDFSDWIKNLVEEYDFEAGKEVFHKTVVNPNGGRPRFDYELTIDCAKEICMVSKTERGRQARKYFIAMEQRAREIKSVDKKLPSFPEALRLLAEQIEATEKLELENLAQSSTILSLSKDVQDTRLCKAKDYKTVMMRNKADIGVSVNRLIQKHFKTDNLSFPEANVASWNAYKQATGVTYGGASTASYEEKLSFLSFLTSL